MIEDVYPSWSSGNSILRICWRLLEIFLEHFWVKYLFLFVYPDCFFVCVTLVLWQSLVQNPSFWWRFRCVTMPSGNVEVGFLTFHFVSFFLCDLSQWSLNYPVWRDQTMQIYRDFWGISPMNSAYSLGWWYQWPLFFFQCDFCWAPQKIVNQGIFTIPRRCF